MLREMASISFEDLVNEAAELPAAIPDMAPNTR
jgi:hypothetical protein